MALGVPKAELPTELHKGMINQLGAVPEPVEVMWHNPKVAHDSVAQRRACRSNLGSTIGSPR